jgi:hypothetical protein
VNKNEVRVDAPSAGFLTVRAWGRLLFSPGVPMSYAVTNVRYAVRRVPIPHILGPAPVLGCTTIALVLTALASLTPARCAIERADQTIDIEPGDFCHVEALAAIECGRQRTF